MHKVHGVFPTPLKTRHSRLATLMEGLRNFQSFVILLSFFLLSSIQSRAEDGYDLWLRYPQVADAQLLQQYQARLKGYWIGGGSPTVGVIKRELERGSGGLLGTAIPATNNLQQDHLLLIGTPANAPFLAKLNLQSALKRLGPEGYLISSQQVNGRPATVIAANEDIGLLYGVFHFLKLLQTQQSIERLGMEHAPRIERRILNHWDNLDRTVERGYAGFSIWDWHRLPDYIDTRYHDYARANASIGINGTVLTNVNANALILRPDYLEKVKALADVFRPYGIRVYLTARFSAPIELGGLATADPLAPEVQQWWAAKVAEIYRLIPDFGGFLVKANSEGQPGPQNYGRSHAEGANMLAEALKPHNGIVMWRAFVYSAEEPEDRAKQAYNEFVPLDGSFLPNVMVQVKNGPIDFQPREPIHPLFGAMPRTPLAMEFQITQEYLGQGTNLVYLAPMYEEVLDFDTHARGAGSTVAKVIDGSLHNYRLTAMAGVANIGNDRNWTGHLFGQANWYAYGRLAWDTDLSSDRIAEEWLRMTFSNDDKTIQSLSDMMIASYEACVNYMTPLGLHHIMGPGHHYGPGPWVKDMPRADWTSVYYHRADSVGIGFDRTASGSDAVSQYFPPVRDLFASRERCPEMYLLWFHHLPWDDKLDSGRSLWDELCLRYDQGVKEVTRMRKTWRSVAGEVDEERFKQVDMLLQIQEKEAQWWRDACLSYFQTFSKRPFPEGVARPDKSLEYYRELSYPYAPGIRPRW